jgi:hypothetical protein
MPNRSDKRDALALSAYLSGLELEFIDGVDPATIPEKAYPQVRSSQKMHKEVDLTWSRIGSLQRMSPRELLVAGVVI